MRRLSILLVPALAFAMVRAGAATVPDGLPPGSAERLVRGEPVVMTVAGAGYELRARLRPMLGPRARIVSIGRGGREVAAPAPRTTTYEGVTSAPFSVRLAIRDGTVDGLVLDPLGDGWWLEARPGGGARARPLGSLKLEPIEADAVATGTPVPAPDAGGSGRLLLRLALEADRAFVAANPGTAWSEQLLEVASFVEQVYEPQMNADFRVDWLGGWEAPDPYPSSIACQGAGGANQIGKLEQLRAYWNATPERKAVARDVVHLFTPSLGGAFIGCAFIGALSDANAYGVDRLLAQPGDGWLYNNVHLFAHELGHNWGGLHERSIGVYGLAPQRSSPGGTIMNPIAEFGALRFSELPVRHPLTGWELNNSGPMRSFGASRLARA